MSNQNPFEGYKPFGDTAYNPWGTPEVPTPTVPIASNTVPVSTYDPTLGMQEKGYSPFGQMSYRISPWDRESLLSGLTLKDTISTPSGVDEWGNPVESLSSVYVDPQSGETYTLSDNLLSDQEALDKLTQRAISNELKVRDANPLYKQLGELEGLSGVSYANKGLTSEQNRETIAARLAEYGITSMDQLGVTTDPSGQQVFYNKQTGKQLPKNVGYTTYGEGMQNYNLYATPDGRVVPIAEWENTSDAGKIAQGLSIAAALAAPWALPALGGVAGLGAIGGGTLYGAGTGALTSGVAGGNIAKGALVGGATGAVGGAIGGGTGQWNPGSSLTGTTSLQNIINGGVRGALTGGLGTAAYGGNGLQGALLGGTAGALGTLANQQLAQTGINDKVAGFLSNQFGKTIANNFLGNQAANTAKQTGSGTVPTAMGGSNAVNIAGISNLPQEAQQKILGALQRLGVNYG